MTSLNREICIFVFAYHPPRFMLGMSSISSRLFLFIQLLEVVRLESHPLAQEDAFMSRDVHLLQVSSSSLRQYHL